MTIREFYSSTGGEYGDVLARFLSEERILRFLRMFPDDPSFGVLDAVFPETDGGEAAPEGSPAGGRGIPSPEDAGAVRAEGAPEVSEASLDEAFRAAHTLKGVCLNLGLARLYACADALTEALRARDAAGARALMPGVRRSLAEVLDALRQLEQP